MSGANVLAQRYNFQHLSIQQGLPQSQAHAIIFDNDQYAWIGTQGGGLCRYDGTEFLYFTKNDSLLSNRIADLELINDQIYVCQKGGVTKVDPKGKILANYRSDDPSVNFVDVVHFQNEILFASDQGVWKIHENRLIQTETNILLNNKMCNSFFVDQDSLLWVCTNSGILNYYDPDKKVNKSRGLKDDQINVVIKYQNYWVIGTHGRGIQIYDPYKEKKLIDNPKILSELDDKIILTLFLGANDEVWIGTMNNGVYVYDMNEGTLRQYDAANGMSNNQVRVVVADRWENIWIGTGGGGVSVFQNSPFMEYNTATGLNSNYVFTVINANGNNLWAGTEGTGVVRINDTSTVLFDEEYGFVSAKVKTLFEDRNGDVWIGTEGDGLGVFVQRDGKDTIYRFGKRNGLPSDFIRDFDQRNNSAIYVASYDNGMAKINKGINYPNVISVSKVKCDDIEIPDRLSSIEFIGEKLWFTSPDGSFGWIDEKRNGWLENYPDLSFRNVTGNGNKIWLGTQDEGILELTFENDSLIQEKWITTGDHIRSNNIYQLVWDDQFLWIGSEQGLDRIQFDSLFDIAAINTYGYEEGFEGVETNMNAIHVDDDGSLWFGTVDGLYRYVGGEANYAQRKPPVLKLIDFSIFYESIDSTEFSEYYENGKMTKDLLLPNDMNHIGFSFKAIHFTYAKDIKYRWRLVGVDPDWTPPSSITTATYSNLPPGKFKFEVKASIDDSWDMEPISISFSIDQPYWEKFWFKAMYYSLIGFVLLMIALIIFLRVRRKNKAIREKLEIEKNLIELEQKALRLQMNPHFIFNVLNSIHNLIILNDPDKARYALSKFSKLMRHVLENSREKFISVDDEVETLENYVQLEKLTSNHDVDLIIEIDENVDPAENLLPPLMIQPFVENALIHGLKDLDYPGQIKVGFKLIHDHLLECFVQDNGKGREAAAKINAQKENYHKSTALKVTQERLASLNKGVDFVPFEIIDLKDDSGNPIGTKVVFRLAI